jgi:hypothetical protein
MRQMTTPLSPELAAQVRRAAAALYTDGPQPRREVLGEALAMDAADRVVLREVDIKLKDGQRLRVAQTTPEARPPFEWLMEITSDIGEADYFKHYLIRADDIVLAERKDLYPIDDTEAELILHDLAVARAAMEAGELKATRKKRS